MLQQEFAASPSPIGTNGHADTVGRWSADPARVPDRRSPGLQRQPFSKEEPPPKLRHITSQPYDAWTYGAKLGGNCVILRHIASPPYAAWTYVKSARGPALPSWHRWRHAGMETSPRERRGPWSGSPATARGGDHREWSNRPSSIDGLESGLQAEETG